MDTSRLESLLEQLLDKQDELISRIESLEATVEQQLAETNTNISELQFSSSKIYEELIWWGEDTNPTLAKQVLRALQGIQSSI